jgi:hypothetical protein
MYIAPLNYTYLGKCSVYLSGMYPYRKESAFKCSIFGQKG